MKMRAMIVPEPGGLFRTEERNLPEPGHHEVRIRVHACGVCHSDSPENQTPAMARFKQDAEAQKALSRTLKL
jgi:Zn-dependent alcohol dehydrogenase